MKEMIRVVSSVINKNLKNFEPEMIEISKSETFQTRIVKIIYIENEIPKAISFTAPMRYNYIMSDGESPLSIEFEMFVKHHLSQYFN